MSGSWKTQGGGSGKVSRALLRCAIRGGSRTEFLREASREILGFTGADALDLWFKDGELCHHWLSALRPEPIYRLTNLSPWAGSEPGTRGAGGRTSAGSFLEQILPLMDDAEGLVTSARRTTGGSLWCVEPNPGPGAAEEPGLAGAAASEAAGRHFPSVAIVPFEIDGQGEGILRLNSTQPTFFTQAQVESYEDLARSLSAAMVNHRAQAALSERIKELTCMYRIAHIASQPNHSLAATLQEVVELLPPAWQHPALARARIILDEHTFPSHDFEVGPHCLGAEIVVQGVARGRVEVFYADQGRDPDQEKLLEDLPFLEEENHLIEGVAREVALIIERHQAELERIRLQEKIRHADRLATIGQLAAGVAHELNEPLANILGFAQLAQAAPGIPDQTRRDVEKIVTASLYAREVVKKLMFFSRQTPGRMMDVDLNRVVKDGISLLESRCAKAGITVVHKLSPEVPLVWGDPAQLQQVLVNLTVNAIQAMPDGGSLEIATLVEDGTVSLILEDTGVGIPPENVSRIFTPFFTTKDVGEGTGLGLSVVHGIVSAHGGLATVESDVGKGTRFVIRLPKAGPKRENCSHGG